MLSLGASCIPKESERTHGLSARPLSTYSQGPCRGSLSRGSDNTSEQGSFPRTQGIPVQASFQGTHKSPIQGPSQDLTGSLCKDPPKKNAPRHNKSDPTRSLCRKGCASYKNYPAGTKMSKGLRDPKSNQHHATTRATRHEQSV